MSVNQPTFSLITGASEGIGKELAVQCAKKQMNLILVARTESKLQELADNLTHQHNVIVHYLACDLSKSGSSKAVFDWCEERQLKVNMLVNNAGVGLFDAFDRLSMEAQTDMVHLNILSIVELVHLFLPLLKAQQGYILNVASIAALYPLPYYSVYGATKAFVLSFTKALRYELKGSGVSVSCLCPGDTQTGFFERAGNSGKSGKLMAPEAVAKAALSGLFHHKDVIYPGTVKWLALLPKGLLRYVVRNRVAGYMRKKTG